MLASTYNYTPAPDGTGILGWTQAHSGNGGSGYDQYVSRRSADGHWSTPVVLSNEAYSESPGASAFDGGTSAIIFRDLGSSGAVTGTLFDGSAWGPGETFSGVNSSNPVQSGDGLGTAVVAYTENGSSPRVAFRDGSGPSLRALTVPAVANPGADVAVSVDPRDAVSGLGATTWDFGDGSALATGVSAAHAYAAAGPYTVTVRSEDSLGHVTTKTRTVVISGPAVTGGGSTGGGDATPAQTTTTTATTPAATPNKTTNNAPAAAPAATPQPGAPRVMLAHTQRLSTVLARQAIRTTVVAPQGGTVSSPRRSPGPTPGSSASGRRAWAPGPSGPPPAGRSRSRSSSARPSAPRRPS